MAFPVLHPADRKEARTEVNMKRNDKKYHMRRKPKTGPFPYRGEDKARR